ncbi:MAG: hypothetical protein SGARI_001044 [Bacillariaceae sp.]
MKILTNHQIDPRIVMVTNAGSDRSWVWTAYDFAEGELKETTFAIRLKDTDLAIAFKEKYDAAQAEMKAQEEGEDAAPSAEADEAAAALAGLSTGGDEENKR